MSLPPLDLSLQHLARLPARADSGGPRPAVIALHGRGSNETDLIGLAPYLDDRLLWISPRAPLGLMGGFEWYRLDDIGVPDQPTFEAAVERLDRFVTESVSAYSIDTRRLFLLGFSQGSMMAYALALSQPGRIAGVIAQSGYLPLNAGLNVDETGVRGKPFILTHGTHDDVIPVAWARAARDTLRRLDADVTYHEFPMGHHVSPESIAAIAGWIRRRLV